MGFWNVEGSSAYAVISGTLTVTIKGQSVVRTGTLAYTFENRADVWKIKAQAGPHVVSRTSALGDSAFRPGAAPQLYSRDTDSRSPPISRAVIRIRRASA